MKPFPILPQEIIENIFLWACRPLNSRDTCRAISVVARFAHAIAVQCLYTTLYIPDPTKANVTHLVDQLRKAVPQSIGKSTYASFVRNVCLFIPGGYGYPVDNRRKEKELCLTLLAQNVVHICPNLERILLDEITMETQSVWTGPDMAGSWRNLEITLASYSRSISLIAIIGWSQILRSSITRLHTSGSVTSFHDLHTLEKFMPNLTHIAFSADIVRRQKQAIYAGAQILPPRIQMIVLVFASSYGLENAASAVSGLRRMDTRVYMLLRSSDYRANWLHDLEGNSVWDEAQKQTTDWYSQA